MIKQNVSEILKPIAEEIRRVGEAYLATIRGLELQAEELLEMDCTYGTDGKLFIKIYPDTGVIEIRHRTNDATYYYYPLNPDHNDPWQCKPKERFYTFDFRKTYGRKR